MLSGRIRHSVALRRQRASEIAAIRGSILFDECFYRAAHPEIGGSDPVAHFVWLGAAQGFDPNPLFDLEWYRGCHARLADGSVNPLYHYLSVGLAAGADPHPLFHTSFYAAQLNDLGDEPALAHYLRLAANRSPGDLRIPCPYFDPRLYLAEHEAARASGLDPLMHYLREGAAAGLDPHPMFDTAYYLRQVPAARAARLTPLGHFLREGAHLSPSPLLAPGEPGLPTPALNLRFVTAAQASDAGRSDVSVIIPAYGRPLGTARCLAAIQRRTGTGIAFEVILVDDRPDQPVAPLFAGVEGLRARVNPRNLGFLRSCNAAARLAGGRHLVFLNNDTLVHDNWLAPMVRLADSDPSVGMVGCRLLNADGSLQEAGGGVLADGWGYPYGRDDRPDRSQYSFVREVDVVTGACFLVTRDAFRAVGGFDDRYAPAYYEEYDLAFSLRARGLRVLYQPASQVTHFDASSYGNAARDAASIRNHEQFCRKWTDALADQPRVGAAEFVWRARPAPGGTLLMVEDHVPEHDKHAGAQATLHYIRLMIRLGLRVVLWPYDGLAPQPYTRELEQMGVEVLCAPVRFAEWLAQNGRFIDHVWTARPVMTESVLDAVLAHTGAPIHYLTHDLHFLREQRRHAVDGDSQALTEAATYKRIELGIFDRVDSIITFSEDEAAVIRSLRPHAVIRTAPLFFYDGIDTEPRRPTGRDTLLFVGGFRHLPNVDAVLWLAGEIMPLVWPEIPGARLVVVGSDPPPELTSLAAPLIEIRGHVADLAPLYARARVSINPLRFGAGIKGKIVNSLAEGLPVVTTAIGNEGLKLAHGREALIGETPETLAAGIVSLWRDDVLWSALSAAGLTVIGQRFSEHAAETLLRDLLKLPGMRPRA